MEKFCLNLRVGVVLILLCPPQLGAAIYQWTDEHGRVHYSDRPVDREAKEVEIRTAPATPPQPGLPEERRQKAKQTRDERKKKCLNARARYDRYNTAGAIYDYHDNGERRYLDKADRESFIARLKEEMARYCD